MKSVGKSEAIRVWNSKVRVTQTFVEVQKRRHHAKKAGTAAGQEDAIPPQLKVLQQIAAKKTVDETFNMGSLFEAKAGLRAAVVVPRKDVVADIEKCTFTKSTLKKLKVHLKNNGWGIFAVDDAAKRKRYEKILCDSTDPSLFTKLSLPNVDWAAKIFRFEFVGMQKLFSMPMFPHFGLMEARLCIQGSETIMGMRTDSCPGEDLNTKRQWLASVKGEDLEEVLERGGWIVTHDGSEVVVVPSGCVYLIYTTEESIVLRWSMSSDEACLTRTKHQIAGMLSAFKDIALPSTGYGAFSTFINSD